MTELLALVRKYEPVLRFSKDRRGDPENFFPVAARHYVHESGLRRQAVGWEHPPGQTLLRHLGELSPSEDFYLAYAAGDVPDDDVVLRLLDRGLELAAVPQPEAPRELDWARGLAADRALGGAAVVPRVLVSPEEAAALEARLANRGGVLRQPLDVQGTADAVGESGEAVARAALAAAGEAPAPRGLTGSPAAAEAAAAELEWVVPRGFSALSDSIHRQALQKYERYRDWAAYPPAYHYHVCQDGPYRALQYWFLYAYNDWATHGGHNDHEGDWEVIYVFLDGADQPQHVAYSRHVKIPKVYEPSTASWSEVERVEGSHPVVYVGCGSHASYLERSVHRLLWMRDYAQGDDLAIGPGADQPWGAPVQLSDKPWNLRFAGKWGSLVKSWLGLVRPGTEGPTGPAQKGDKWDHPARWAGLLS